MAEEKASRPDLSPVPDSRSAGAAEVAAGELELRELLAALRRRRWWSIATLAVGMVAAVLLTMTARREYRATATVLIDRAAPEVLAEVREVYDLGESYWNTQQYYETQYKVIRSRPVMELASRNLGLTPAVLTEELRKAGPESVEARAAGDPLFGLPEPLQRRLRMLGLGQQESREAILEALKGYDVPAFLIQAVDVSPIDESRLVWISIDGPDPDFAAGVANAIADAYIDFNLEQKVAMTGSAVDWLSSQQEELKEKLAANETALLEFKKANSIVSVTLEVRQTMIAATLSQLNERLSATRADRLAAESRREQLLRGNGVEAAANLNEAINNGLIQDLRISFATLRAEEIGLEVKYTDEHPSLIGVRQKLAGVEKQLADELGRIRAAIEMEYDALVQTERRLGAAIEDAKSQALELDAKEIEYNRLMRERDNTLALNQLVLKREKEAALTRLLKVNNVRKLEAAVASVVPVRPNVRLNLLIGFALSVAAGLGLALLIDYLDNTLKSQEQVEQLLGLPFLGVVPAIKGEKSASLIEMRDRDRYIIAHPRSTVAECCRTMRTNILLASPDQPLRRLVVTSADPREGKSTIVINLAVTMAQAGARTLIVDTDMRRPRLHRSFNVLGDVGLTNVMLGDATIEQAIVSTPIEGLDILTCGTLPPNPSELVHAKNFERLVDDLGRMYDRIIFDSPPVRAVADALVLSTMVDGVVLVVRYNQTSWQAARQAGRLLTGVGARMFGVVLNFVNLADRSYGGYYSYYQYGRTYGPSDDAEDKKVAG